MKRLRKALIAVLSVTCLTAPLLTSCGPSTSGQTSDSGTTIKLEKIEITKQPNKVDYESGDIFDPTGMEVTAYYNNDTSEVVTDYSYSKLPLTADQTEMTISYKGKRATVKINVKFVLKLMSIEVDTLPNKTNYVVGEKFDPTGMKIAGRYNDGTKKAVTDYTWDKTEALTKEDTVVTITADGKTATVNITVEDKKVDGIRVTKLPNKLAYKVGETLDLTGMEVSTHYNDGSTTPLAKEDWTVDKTAPLTLEDELVTVTYGEMTTTFNISVSEKVLTGLEITTQPNKTEYFVGEKFDATGMVVSALYDDESKKEINNYTIDKADKELTVDDTEVTISFGGFTKSVAITVTEVPNKVNVTKCETIRIEAEYLDFSKAILRDDFIAAGRGFTEPGENASNGLNVCGYNPGSIFEISIHTDKTTTLTIGARMSDTELNYKINDGVRFTVDEEVLLADEPNFTYSGGTDFWNWKEFKIGTVTLEPGDHVFKLEGIGQRPNLDCFDFIVTKYGDEVAEKKLTDLTIKSQPTKTTYQIGEKFDPTGLVLEATYDDYSKEEVTDFTYEPDRELNVFDDHVTVKYKDKEVIVPIVVGKDYAARINGTGNFRVEAENFPQDQLIKRPDAGGHDFIINESSASGGKTLEWYDTGSKVEFSFYVGEKSTINLSLNAAMANNFVFDENFTVKLDDQVLTSNNPEFGSSAESQYYNWTLVDFGDQTIDAGEHKLYIEVTGTNKPNLDYFDFFVKSYGDTQIEHNLESISVETNPTKMNYRVGEVFDKTGMVVKAQYSDRTEEVVEDFTVDKTEPLTADDTLVTISYQGLTTTLKINIESPLFEATEMTTYKVEGEHMDLSNIVPDAPGYSNIENSEGFSSNGQNVGHISSGFMRGYFTTNSDSKLTIQVLFANPAEEKVSDHIESVTVDGKVLTLTEDVILGQTEGNQYYNYKTITYTLDETLAAGSHEVHVNFKAGGNLDYLNFIFAE